MAALSCCLFEACLNGSKLSGSPVVHSDNDLFREAVCCSRVSVVSRAQPAHSNMCRADRKLPLVRALGCDCVIQMAGWSGMEEEMMGLKLF